MWPTLLLLLINAPTDNLVTIDRDWLAQHGPGPYLLDQPRTTYLLKTDVRTAGSAFVVDAPDVTLDLGGHEVVYGDGPPLTVANAGFENGSGRDVPGWDLKDAPAAELAPNTHYLFGKQVLRLKGFRQRQRLVSAPVVVPATTHTHVATITPAAGDYRTALVLTVVDADSGATLGQGKSNNVERGISAVAPFVPGKAKAVRLVVEVTPGEGRTDDLDLDLATVSTSYDYGVVATNAWTGEIPGWSNLASVGPLRRQASNFTLRNGTVRQGQGRGLSSSPAYCPLVRGLTVEDVTCFTSGMDTTTIDVGRAKGPVVIRRCTLKHDVENITDRGKLTSALRLAAVDGTIDVEDNELSGVPQVGILLDGAASGQPVRICKNRIHLKTVVTNGYGLIIAGSRNFEIAHNRIVAENGRGIDVDSFRKEPVAHGHIHHNHVEVREGLNREYRDRLEARALRLRNTVDGKGPHRDLLIDDNTFIATTSDGLAQDAFAVLVTYQNADGAMTGANVRLERNVLRALTTRPGPGSHASALDIDGFDPNVGLVIENNVLESNDTALTLANTQGSVAGFRLVGNTFRRLAEGPERQYHAIRAGFWEHTVHDAAVIGPKLEGQANFDVDWVGAGRKDLARGHLLNLTVRQDEQPVAAAAISVEDRDGKVVFTGTTGTDGKLFTIPLVTVMERQATGNPRQITKDERGPFRVRVTAGGKSTVEEVQVEDNREVVLSLPAR